MSEARQYIDEMPQFGEFLLQATTEESDKERAVRFHEECQADPKTKIDEENMNKFRNGEDSDDQKAMAHALCMSKKSGFQDEHGKVVKDKMKEAMSLAIADEAKLEEVVNKCAVDKATPEKTGSHVWGCMMKAFIDSGYHD